MRRRIVWIAVAGLLAAGCGADDPAPADRPAPSAATPTATAEPARMSSEAPRRPRGTRIRAIDSAFGTILGDRRGQAFYLFDKESGSRSECYGDCARAWPPVLTKGRPVAGKGARQRLLGTTRRRGGKRQVTYNGHPLYYYIDDSPGQVLCHNVLEFGGLWLVVQPDGSPAD